jgi:hypothetical protein
MSGKSIANLVGARVAGMAIYTPGYLKAGQEKPVPAKCDVNVTVNVKTRKHSFKVTGWGGMADIMARGCAVGKELTIIGRLDSYKGRVWMAPDANNNINYFTNSDGTPFLTTKVGITIETLHFGADSKKCIVDEINTGKRPLNYAVPGSGEEQQWLQMCATKNAELYVQGSQMFGYAKVRVLDGTTPVPAQVANNTGTAQFAANVNQQVVNAPVKPLESAKLYNANGQEVDATGTLITPVVIAGQKMGYAATASAPKVVV